MARRDTKTEKDCSVGKSVVGRGFEMANRLEGETDTQKGPFQIYGHEPPRQLHELEHRLYLQICIGILLRRSKGPSVILRFRPG